MRTTTKEQQEVLDAVVAIYRHKNCACIEGDYICTYHNVLINYANWRSTND
jgi:hypothetical protein